MGAAVGRETDAVAFYRALSEAPYVFDFYQTMRRLECLHADKPRWGLAPRPADEPVRLGQEPDLAFAPSALASFETADDSRPARLQVRLFGLLGPNGALPIHLTEFVRERWRHANDPTLMRFLDVFHHRFVALFYRAWAQGQPHVNHDRADDRFGAYVGAFIGAAPAAFRNRDSIADEAKFFHAGALARHVRNADGIAAILQHFFRVPLSIEQFVGHWLDLGRAERSRLGGEGSRLGAGAVAGRRVWDRQYYFRVHLGPLTLTEYESFLPGGVRLKQLVDWLALYLSRELGWDVRLVLKRGEVPRLKLGGTNRLGWTTWLGRRRTADDAADLRLDAEKFTRSPGGAIP